MDTQIAAHQSNNFMQANRAPLARPAAALDGIKKYEFGVVLGQGTYGIVYKAKNKETGEIVAIKQIKLEKDEKDDNYDGMPSTALREISILQKLKHPNIVELKEVIFNKAQLYLVFEYLEFDLKKYVKKLYKEGKTLTSKQIQIFTYQILESLVFMHEQGIFHRDLKPQNILVSDDGSTVKVADFGLARAFGMPIGTYTHEVVTLWYRCPEILLCKKQYSLGVDIWSTGCIFAEMIQQKPLFTGDSEIDQIFKIFKVMGTPHENNWPEALKLNEMKSKFPKFRMTPMSGHTPRLNEFEVDLLENLVALDPNKRVSAKLALQHPYFDTLDKSKSMM